MTSTTREVLSLVKEKFSRMFRVATIKVAASSVGQLRPLLGQNEILALPKIKSVIVDPSDPQKRMILLNENIKEDSDLSVGSRDAIVKFGGTFAPNDHEITIGFDQLSPQEILRQLLPPGLEVPSSFESAGHLAHVNLRDDLLPYQNIIGEVILAKNPHIQLVVNKLAAIDTTFRCFPLEVIARRSSNSHNDSDGDKNEMIVSVRESECSFRFDYSKVYWNSRLQAEHWRLVEEFRRGDAVCDLFCGVGPFAIHAAKHRQCLVYANDLNPESIKWLTENRRRNRIDSQLLHIFNEDARSFLKTALTQRPIGFNHYIMNLPASAHEFLDAFTKLAADGTLPLQNPPALIHCYVFCRNDEDPLDKIEAGLNYAIDRNSASIKRVRDVAPKKEMFCVSFSLPASMFATSKRSNDLLIGNGDRPEQESHQSKTTKLE